MRVAAQDPELLKSRVLTAVRQASLVSPTVKPYRMVATITVFDGAGKNPQVGSMEQIRSGRNLRTEVTFPGSLLTVLNSAKGNYFSAQGNLPYYAPSLVKAAHTPFEFTGFGTDAAVKPAGLPADIQVECIAVNSAPSGLVEGSRALVHEVCLDRGADDLRVVVDDKLEYLRSDLVSFDGQRIARRVDLHLGGFVIGTAQITSLENIVHEENIFVPVADMKLIENTPEHVPASVMAGRLLNHENPKFPMRAKFAHIQGVVVLHAVIGKDGHIGNLSVISSPDNMLSEASIKAVSKWTYEPYLLNGTPTEVDTTITVQFAFGAQ